MAYSSTKQRSDGGKLCKANINDAKQPDTGIVPRHVQKNGRFLPDRTSTSASNSSDCIGGSILPMILLLGRTVSMRTLLLVPVLEVLQVLTSLLLLLLTETLRLHHFSRSHDPTSIDQHLRFCQHCQSYQEVWSHQDIWPLRSPVSPTVKDVNFSDRTAVVRRSPRDHTPGFFRCTRFGLRCSEQSTCSECAKYPGASYTYPDKNYNKLARVLKT